MSPLLLIAPLLSTIPLAASPVWTSPGPPDVRAEEPIALEGLLERVVAARKVPALTAAIVSGGEVRAIGAVGVRARGSEERVTRNDLWHIGSCTKAMTATLLAKLAEDEVLSLDDTLDELFPELADDMVEDWKHVTLQQVLQHRSGMDANPITLWGALTANDGGPRGARAQLVLETLLAPPARVPGEYLYSNTGYTIAGAAAERATGRSWEELMREQVFEPLGMRSAGFGPPGSADEVDQPRGHHGSQPRPPGPGADNPAWLGPAGTVHATLRDWARFAALHLAGARGEETAILSQRSFAQLHAVPEGSNYASGWIVEPRDWAGGDVLIHNGSNTMWYAVIFAAPERDLAFLAATNEAGPAGAAACEEAVVAALELWDSKK